MVINPIPRGKITYLKINIIINYKDLKTFNSMLYWSIC